MQRCIAVKARKQKFETIRDIEGFFFGGFGDDEGVIGDPAGFIERHERGRDQAFAIGRGEENKFAGFLGTRRLKRIDWENAALFLDA